MLPMLRSGNAHMFDLLSFCYRFKLSLKLVDGLQDLTCTFASHVCVISSEIAW